MKKITNIEVELRKGNDDKISFYLKQYDDVVLNIKVYDGLSPLDLSGETVYLAIDKPDGTKVLQKDNIEVDANDITINLSPQAVAIAGMCKLELILESDEGLLTTAVTNFMVAESLSTSIVDIITSSDDIHHLRLIEEFILNSNLSIEDITYSLNAIKERIKELEEELEIVGAEAIENVGIAEDDAIENIGIVKDDALGEIDKSKNELLENVESIKDEIVSKGNEVISNVETAKGEVNELIATIEASKEEVEELGRAQVENIMGAGVSAKIEIDTAKTNAINEVDKYVNQTVDTAKNEINSSKDDAINEIGAKKDEIVAKANEEMASKKDEIVEGTTNEIDKAKNDAITEANSAISEINNAVSLMKNTKDECIEGINTVKDDAISEVNSAVSNIEAIKDECIGEIDTVKGNAINEVNNAISNIENVKDEAIENVLQTKDEAVEVIGVTKDTTIEEMTAKKDALIEELSQVETGTVEGVEEAVEAAQKRLQEASIQCIWDVQEVAEGEKDALGAVSNIEQGNISKKATEQVERVNQAGANIVAMVEGLEANIDEGLSEINGAIRTGKSEINELSNTKLEAIRAEGQEILDLVSNIESLTGDYVEAINNTGDRALGMLESYTNSCKSELTEKTKELKESISTAGNEKLEEINSILGVSRGEVEELLETTRAEINSHRAETNEMITNLKDNSISEMTNAKNDFINEILGAEIELKEDFKTLTDGYLAEIDAKGTARIDALQNMIDAIDRLQEAVENDLEIAERRAKTLDDKLSDVDNKMAEIQPVLNNLNEMRNVCISLQAENTHAEEHIEELGYYCIESDTRVVELRRLIDEAKSIEDLLVDYIENKSGNHDEIEARLTALEDAIGAIDLSPYATKEELSEAINNIEIPDIEGLATKTELQEAINNIEIPDMPDLSDYATKEELSEAVNGIEIPSIEGLVNQEQLEAKAQEIIDMIPESSGSADIDLSDYAMKDEVYTKDEIDNRLPNYNGLIGDSDYPSVFANCPEPDLETVGVIEAFCVYNKRYVKIYIHQLKEGTTMADAVKVLDYSTTYRLHVSTSAIPSYTVYAKKETEEWTKVTETGTSFYCYLNTKDKQLIRRLIYRNDMPLECSHSSYAMILDAYAGESGAIGSYDDAVKVGTYKVSHKSRITGAPKDTIEGVLTIEKADDRLIQRLVDNKGKVYTRYKGDSWGQWVGEGNIGEITYAVKTLFDNIPEYSAPGWRLMPEKSSEYPYRLVVLLGTNYGRIIDSKQDLTGYIRYNKSTNKIVLGEGYENLEMKHYYLSNVVSPNYSYSNMGWDESTSATQYLSSVVKSWYAHNFDILDADGNVVRKSDEFDTSNVTLDFNEAIDKDMYKVDIQVDDDIANKPHNERIRGFMEVRKCGAIIKQTLTTAETEYYRVYDEDWSNWRTIVTQDMFYNLMSLMNINAK